MTQVCRWLQAVEDLAAADDSSGGNRTRRALGSGTSLSGNPEQWSTAGAGLRTPKSAVGTDWYSNQAARTTSPCRRQANLSQVALLAAAEGDSSTDTETATAIGFVGRQQQRAG